MTLQVALLRGVNLGKRKVVMSELRALCEAAGFTEVRTLLASGNLVLRSKLKPDALEAKLEREIEAGLGLKTAVFVRSGAELVKVIAANPFPEFAERDPSHALVTFLKAPPNAAQKKAINAPREGPEQIHAIGRHVYITFPVGIADSRLRLPVEGTARNWNTVTKLAAMAAES